MSLAKNYSAAYLSQLLLYFSPLSMLCMALWKFDASLPTSALYCITHVEYDKCKLEGVLGPLCT